MAPDGRYVGTKTAQTIYTIVGFTIVNIIGTIILLTITPSPTTRGGLLVAFYFMQSFQALSPSLYTMVSRNIAGQTKKSIVYAAFFVGWAGGNAVASQLFRDEWKPRYFNSLYIHLGIYGAFILDLLAMRVMLVRRNRQRDMAMVAQGKDQSHELAFEDMTDLQNVEFRYSY